jgi:predicted AAA+ superfamily ATPase
MERKKIKLDNLHQTHGKIENRAITLDQIWGDDGKRKYGTLNIEDYNVYLSDLNKSDLQAHAVKIGLVPVDNRETLVKRLKQEFKKHVSSYLARPNIDNTTKLSKSSRDTLSEGR